MSEIVEDQLVADLVREQVARIAPQELPIFRAASKAYFNDPKKALEGQQGKEHMLGFGVELAAVSYLTPYIFPIMETVVAFLAKEVAKSVETETSGVISNRIKQMFKKFRLADKEEEREASPLTLELVTQVRKIAFEKACQLNLPEGQAGLLADSVAGSLATASA